MRRALKAAVVNETQQGFFAYSVSKPAGGIIQPQIIDKFGGCDTVIFFHTAGQMLLAFAAELQHSG